MGRDIRDALLEQLFLFGVLVHQVEQQGFTFVGSGDLLESATLVDDYRGEGLDAGLKSLSFALRFRASDRTLTAAEATEAKLAGVAVAAARFGATVRE